MNSTTETQRARYTRNDGKIQVKGFWQHRGGCLWLGEISVLTPNSVLRFSSTTPMSNDGLRGYATDEYLARHAARFIARPWGE